MNVREVSALLTLDAARVTKDRGVAATLPANKAAVAAEYKLNAIGGKKQAWQTNERNPKKLTFLYILFNLLTETRVAYPRAVDGNPI